MFDLLDRNFDAGEILDSQITSQQFVEQIVNGETKMTLSVKPVILDKESQPDSIAMGK